MTLETWLKNLTNVCNFVTASPQTIYKLFFFHDFCDIPENADMEIFELVPPEY